MNVLRLYGAGDLRLETGALPVPAPGEAIVRVTAVGICGSDLHWYAESGVGDAVLDQPLVLGHEAAGVIESGSRAGERVAIDPSIPCGACEPCREGRAHLCLAVRFAGNGPTDGTLRDAMAWPERCLVPVPPSLSDAEVALLEPLGVALHAVGLGDLRPGSSVGVFGCGPIGLMIVQLARASGATTIVATDRLEHRLEAARRAGAAVAAPVSGGAEREELRRATGGRGVDVAFEVAGEDDAVETAIALARPAATVVLVGIPGTDSTTFTASTARHKGLTLKLSRRMNRTYARAIRLVESGTVSLSPLVTADLPLTAFDSAFRIAARREGLKVVIRPSGTPDATGG
jgi:L-iditol 2-dehydrogenase